MEFLSSVFQPIVDLMSSLVTYAFQLTQMVGYPSYGVAIILLTIFIKTLTSIFAFGRLKVSYQDKLQTKPHPNSLGITSLILIENSFLSEIRAPR